MFPAYYNEIDPQAAAWLRELISAGLIAPGDVDERSIEDVRPDELVGYRQCHFFAGIGVWSYALRRAGWDDEREIWTGSCPCQPFSTAGKGAGFSDERHLWPAFFHLIEQCRPAAVFGEQVASGDADPWIDLVCADMERLGYAFGATAFPTAGIGGPHIRDRIYWAGLAGVALGDTGGAGLEGWRQGLAAASRWHGAAGSTPTTGESSGLAHAHEGQRGRIADGEGREPDRPSAGWKQGDSGAGSGSDVGRLAYADRQRCGEARERELSAGRTERAECGGHVGGLADADGERRPGDQGPQRGVPGRPHGAVGHGMPASGRPGPVNGFWRAADWLACRDGRWRPVEPGTFPLAHGAAARVGRLRGYGNAINAEAARVFIECVMEAA